METLNENIVRPRYMERILPYVDKGIIKVLTGQRRVGKSYILDAVAKYISSTRADVNIVDIDLEDFAFSHIKDDATLNNEIIARLSETKRNYIFIDEIQEVDGFDKVLRSLAQNPLNDIYVTGSNSEMLSTEMASRLAGR
ncbi:MAG: AAA family ATPase, partial [Muribaculaceae bacterium]|nr:AAA family ATPase [Muribaculaceae bacterium]